VPEDLWRSICCNCHKAFGEEGKQWGNIGVSQNSQFGKAVTLEVFYSYPEVWV